ncbi:uncharacterized protein LOC126894371 isoform X2 [Daktulosphaira vitifoliae]|uniref:uncharacterized protein LOC126894371 isoform X2 n=1 Tax=Daktulosphaira vitifoliae TaxID=58002 RepID=UPI0021AACF9D|nr:uncharacterized protein LOC126894371 isoform X2 [Daktulosphaira vitifoliae]
MVLIKVNLILFFLHKINSNYVVNLKNITMNDLVLLKIDYKNIMGLQLKDHLFYSRLNMDKMVCPIPWSHTGHYDEIIYGKIEIANKSLSRVVHACFLNGKYSLGYAIILNTIESIGITYIYRFCEFAREMNRRQIILTNYYNDFSEILYLLRVIFNREWISLDPYECLIIVYKKHKSKYTNFEFNNLDEDYRSDLFSCMESMKIKINFVDVESPLRPLENLSNEELFILWQNDKQNIIKLYNLDKGYLFYLKNMDGDRAENSCIVCMNPEYMVKKIYSFVPCGHSWCCNNCLHKIDKCPLCRQNYSNYQVMKVITPSISYAKIDREKIPRSLIGQENMRCINCLRLIKDAVPKNKYIVIPCGHGWYCNDCAIRESKKQLKCRRIDIVIK